MSAPVWGRFGIMRYICWLIVCICLVEFSTAEPCTAPIAVDRTIVWSGPGAEFYPVSHLQTGDTVEVYYEQGDWYAIRPPIGSFSWVSAAYIDSGSGTIGTVLADGLASRIGSEYSDDCETVQVTLKKGEVVLLLERREMPENLASPVWFKIAPPNGEFRWIPKSALGTSPPIQQVRHDVMATAIPELPKTMHPEQSIPVPKIASLSSMSAPQRNLSPSIADPFHKAFNELQRESYIVMTRPTDDDVFSVLIQRANELHQIAPTDQDLEKTYQLLESLQRTRAVRRELALRRPMTIGANQHTPPRSSLPAVNSGTPASPQSIVPAYASASVQSGSTPIWAGVNVGGYDIVGRLGEFEPLPKGHPPYAVVDEKEQIICMISPSANLDLSLYVGQFVGINGVLSYYEKPGKPRSRHLTAQNIRSLR